MLKYMKMYGMRDEPIKRPLFGTFWLPDDHGWIFKF
jgi:hypothetical protein